MNRGRFLSSDVLDAKAYSDPKDPPHTKLKEKVITDYIGFGLFPHSFMHQVMNRRVVQFVESGLAQKAIRRYRRRLQKHASDDGPQVLSLEHLKAGFCIWLACIAVAVFAFLCERYLVKLIPNWFLAWDHHRSN